MKAGDIVNWSPVPGKNGKDWRIVENWADSEPKRLLLAEPEGSEMRCYVALLCDCSFVRAGEPPTRARQGSSVADIWKVPDNCVIAEDR